MGFVYASGAEDCIRRKNCG